MDLAKARRMLSCGLLIFLGCILLPSISSGQDLQELYPLPDCSDSKSIVFDLEVIGKLENRHFYESSYDTLTSLYCFAEASGNLELMAISLGKLADIYLKSDERIDVFQRAMAYASLALDISQEHGYDQAYLNVQEVLCSSFTSNDMFEQAISAGQAFLDKAISLQDSVRIAEGYMLLGRALRDKGSWYQADHHLKLSLKFVTGSNYSNKIAGFSYLHQSNLKRLEEKYDESIALANKGMVYATQTIAQRDLLIAFLKMEIILCKIQLGEETEPLFENLMGESKVFDLFFRAEFYFTKGMMHEKKNEVGQAVHNYLETMRISEELGAASRALETSQRIIPLLEISNDTDSYNKFLKYQNGINKLMAQNSSNNLFRTAYFKYEDELIKNDILEENLYNSRNVNLLSIGIIVMLVLLSFLLFKQVRQRKSYYFNLNRLNDELSQTNRNLFETNRNVEKKRDELQLEIKELLIFLSSHENQLNKINWMLRKNEEIDPVFSKKLQGIMDFRRNKEVIERVNLKFLEMNSELIENLSRDFPKLTANDLNLCSFLSMNMSTKDIAQLQYRSTESIKVARSRLRRKLEIDNQQIKLASFLNSYKSSA